MAFLFGYGTSFVTHIGRGLLHDRRARADQSIRQTLATAVRKVKEVVTHAKAPALFACSVDGRVLGGDDIHRNPNAQLIGVRDAYL